MSDYFGVIQPAAGCIYKVIAQYTAQAQRKAGHGTGRVIYTGLSIHDLGRNLFFSDGEVADHGYHVAEVDAGLGDSGGFKLVGIHVKLTCRTQRGADGGNIKYRLTRGAVRYGYLIPGDTGP